MKHYIQLSSYKSTFRQTAIHCGDVAIVDLFSDDENTGIVITFAWGESRVFDFKSLDEARRHYARIQKQLADYQEWLEEFHSDKSNGTPRLN